MANKKIIDYIKLCIDKGFKLDAIITKLKNMGWSEKEINEAIDVYTDNLEIPKEIEIPEIAPVEPQPQPAPEQEPLPQQKQDPMSEIWDYGQREYVDQDSNVAQDVPMHVPLPTSQAPSKRGPPGPPPKPPLGAPGKKANMGFIVSVVAGILMLIASVSNLLISYLKIFSYTDLEFLYTLMILPLDSASIVASLGSPTGQMLIFVSVALSALTIVGAVIMFSKGKEKIGGLIILIASAVNLGAFWGLGMLGIIGGFIGIVGGILGILKK